MYLIDVQTTSDAIEAQQAKINQMNATYSRHVEACREQGVVPPEGLKEKIAKLNADFEEVKQLSKNINKRTEPQITEVMEQGLPLSLSQKPLHYLFPNWEALPWNSGNVNKNVYNL